MILFSVLLVYITYIIFPEIDQFCDIVRTFVWPLSHTV